MFSKKKIEASFSQKSLRRRFHHLLISKRRGVTLPKSTVHLDRPKRKARAQLSPFFALLRTIFSYALIAAFFVGLFYLVFFSSFFAVSKIAIDKTGSTVATNSLAPFLEKLRGKNILFIHTDSLEREMEQTFRNEILLIKIKKSYPSSLKVKVDEYPAVLNLRAIAGGVTQKFVLNQIGYAIFENTENKDLPTLVLNAATPYKGKSIMIAKEKMDSIVEAFTKFTDVFGMKIISGEWLKVERELHLNTERNFSVWLDLTLPIDEQLGKLKRALPKLDIFHENLEYLDLRIPSGINEKVIYKKRK